MHHAAPPQRARVAPLPRALASVRRRHRAPVPSAAACDAAALRTLYPAATARASGTLPVDAPHVLYYEEYGNAGAPQPKASPAIRTVLMRRLRSAAACSRAPRCVAADGVPALVVHGGPGAACWPNHARFFDPQRACPVSWLWLAAAAVRRRAAMPRGLHRARFASLRLPRMRADYRIVLLDQRGCGRSKPLACLERNTTDALARPQRLPLRTMRARAAAKRLTPRRAGC
jgi:hypothetical protein